jgi:phosphoribosylformylglycinamidine cyclo-ligase
VTDPNRDAGEAAYRSAGVDVTEGRRAVSLFEDAVAAASRPEVVEGIGGFAGLFDVGDGRYLAAATDGVGTKLEVARLLGRVDTVGVDLVAMCANDVVCAGAEPLFFLDYLAVERLVPEEAASIVAGVARGCAEAGCALLGGETAEHPETMGEGRFDLAGFCVGLVEADHVLRPENARPGDALIGLRSSGLHANGFSLVRRALLGDREAGHDAEKVNLLEGFRAELGRTLGEELLEPTRIYVKTVLTLARAGLVRSAAHITGGGWSENLPRALPEGLGAEVWTERWRRHAIFDLVANAAGIAADDLFGVLNMGIGMVLVIDPGDIDRALTAATAAGDDATVIGRVVEGADLRVMWRRGRRPAETPRGP